MTLTYPYALFGLLTLPYFLWLGKPRSAWARGRAVAALLLRALIVLLLVLALAGLQLVRAGDKLAVVFLIDASDSMSEASIEAAHQYVADAMSRMGPDDEAAIIVFGSDALVERPMSPVKEIGPFESQVLPLHTDLAEAIRLGMALYPPGAARRMVILSDGLANVGDAEGAARLASASGIQILAVPFSAMQGNEILVTNVDVPTRLQEGQVFDLTVTVESNLETPATLRVLGGGVILAENAVNLVQGMNRFTFTLTATEPGLTSFRVQIVPAGEDQFYQNNELSAFAQVVGPPRVLIVADEDTESLYLGQALLQQGLTVDTVGSSGLPADLATLSNYQSVILMNIPARNLGPRRMQLLQMYVRDLGGGLVVIGGPNTYGPGGYFQTPLEETLPVEMQLKDQERLPQLTVVYVIDKSGSMADTSVGGFQKVELAKEAIIRSINLLGPLDRVGVVAFDENASWVVPLGPMTDRNQVALQVGTIRADGGTDIYAGVLAVSQVLPDDPSQLRHVVLLTDGGADPSGNLELVREMYEEHGITFSVIAIGQGYAPWLEELPEAADGRFHYAYDVDTIPEIFSEETVIATRAYTIEGEFYPTLTSTSPIMNGITQVPPLLGYIGTSIKPTAQQILVTQHDDPLLAAWQYGLGRSVAWTSDATARWGVHWVSWPEYARFWGQAVRWTITEGANQNVEVTVVQEGETAHIIVDAVDADGDYLNDLELDASVVSPDLSASPVELEQVAPGRYEGTFEPGTEGAYFVRVAGAVPTGGADQASVAQTSGWVLAYSPEYRSLEGDPEFLAYLTDLTGGALVDNVEPIFAHNLAARRDTQPVWSWLVLAATLLLPFDIAVRRLVLTRSDLRRVATWLGLTRQRAASVAPGASRVGPLLGVKERIAAGRETAPAASPPSSSTLARLKQAKGERPTDQQGEVTTSTPHPAVARPTPPSRPARPQPAAPRPPVPDRASGGSTASALLKSKRRRKGDQDES